MIHFGLTPYASAFLYASFILAFLLSVLWRPIVGIYFLVPLIPLQTARYYLIDFPLGKSVVDIILLGVVLGLLVHRQRVFPKTPWNLLLGLYTIFTFVSLCLGSFYLGSALPFSISDPRLADWKNYMAMPLILILVAATVRNTRQMKILVLLMCLAALMLNRGFWDTVSGRDFSNFTDDLRDAGGMGYAGVNGFAAFEAQFAVFLLALAAFKERLLSKLGFVGLAGFSVICLMYSFSRGGYLALLVGCLFLGLVKQRKFLILLVVFISMWTSLTPLAVQQRVQMTYDANGGELDHSSELRLDLWKQAMPIFDSNPVIGAGFFTYAYTHHMNNYADTHDFFIKVLVETGFVGLMIFLWLLAKTFITGYKLFRGSQDPFLASLGLGLAVWVVSSFVANCFGDRWTYLQVNGYMWVLGGLVARALILEQDAVVPGAEDNSAASDAQADGVVLRPQPAGLV
jgi:O-antigen ligase